MATNRKAQSHGCSMCAVTVHIVPFGAICSHTREDVAASTTTTTENRLNTHLSVLTVKADDRSKSLQQSALGMVVVRDGVEYRRTKTRHARSSQCVAHAAPCDAAHCSALHHHYHHHHARVARQRSLTAEAHPQVAHRSAPISRRRIIPPSALPLPGSLA